MKLEQLVSQLKNAYGSALQSIILYGSAVAGEYVANRSDYNVIVIADKLPLENLRAASAVARAWHDSGNPPPMTFTLEEWRASADIFPMEYSDILERHKVLHGDESVFEGISVNREHLRLQLENQAVGKLLKLRQGALLAGSDAKRQAELLEASLSTFMVIGRALLRLHGEPAPTDYETLTTRVSQLAGFPPEPFYAVIRHFRGTQKLHKDQARATLEGYLAGVERLAAYVNQA
jgi:hypothetical protein